MSYTIETGKEFSNPGRPLILVHVSCTDGHNEYLGSAAELGHDYLTYGGNQYLCRISDQTVGAIQAMSQQGYDIPGSVTLKINDGDLSLWTNSISAHAWRGATLTLIMILWDATASTFSTNGYTWTFIGGKPNYDAGKAVITIEAQALTSMTRLTVPSEARRVLCQWTFPATSAQRLAGLTDPTSSYSPCGYSPDQSATGWDGTPHVGNLNGGSPFTTCDYTRQSCIARGMFKTDSSSNITARFSGDTWTAPTQYSGRSYLTGQKVYGFNRPNPANGTEYYNHVLGQQWVTATVLEPAGNPDSLRCEAVVCMAYYGPVVQILKVVVNGVEIPYQYNDVLFTWRYAGGTIGSPLRGSGGRNGCINQDNIFNLSPGGDPHGSMCVIEVVVNTAVANNQKPAVEVLVQGPPIAVFTDLGGGSFSVAYQYSTNPVWHLIYLLCALGPFTYAMLELDTFCAAATWCDQIINYTDSNGNTQSHARFRSSFALPGASPKILAQAVTELRNCAGIILSKNPSNGALKCNIKRGMADQQPSPISGSNDTTGYSAVKADGTTGTGYLAYHFDGAGSIKTGTFNLGGRSINDTPNRYSFRFQNEDNQQSNDSISVVDPKGYTSAGNQFIDIAFPQAGIPNFDQASRRINVELAEALYGNLRNDAGGTEYLDFETTVKAAHLAGMVGGICGITYDQLGL